MARPPMRNRTIRVTDAEWTSALAEADRRHENLSEAIRDFVRRYGRGEDRPVSAPATPAPEPPALAE